MLTRPSIPPKKFEPIRGPAAAGAWPGGGAPAVCARRNCPGCCCTGYPGGGMDLHKLYCSKISTFTARLGLLSATFRPQKENIQGAARSKREERE